MLALLLTLVALSLVMLSGVRVMREYERSVVFRLGRARKQLVGPGLVFMLPLGIDRARTIDIRTKVVQIPPQEVITQDNISVMVDAVVYITVESPMHAVLEVEQFMTATLQLAATTMRAVVGRMDLDDILAHRDRINDEVRTILDTRTEQWGVEISAVELKDIVLPQEMKRALARQAEAERERRAKVIAAEGELQAAARLTEAAEVIARSPGAMQLRLYQTLSEISSEPSSKIVLPIPIELMAGIAPRGITAEQITTIVQQALAGGSVGTAKVSHGEPVRSVAGVASPAAITPRATGGE
jgi:regulator of protease activity HflC (stomatin/prohibitin superfamily)